MFKVQYPNEFSGLCTTTVHTIGNNEDGTVVESGKYNADADEYNETGSSSDGSDTMDSDSDSASDCLVSPSPKLTNQRRKFEKFERQRVVQYFSNRNQCPSVSTVTKYLEKDPYMRKRVDFCLEKYSSPRTRLRFFRNQVVQWYKHRETVNKFKF